MRHVLRPFVLGFLLLLAVLTVQAQTANPNMPDGIEVVDFHITPDTIDRGDQITLQWDVQGLDRVSIYQFYGGYRSPHDVVYQDLPAQGSMTIYLTSTQPQVNQPAQPYVYDATFTLYMPDVEFSWYDGTNWLDTIQVKVNCPDTSFFWGDDPFERCPVASATTIDLVYQPFEGGFMLQRGDTGMVYTSINNPDGVSGTGLRFTDQEYLGWEPAFSSWTVENTSDSTWDFPAEWTASRSAPGDFPPLGDLGRVWFNSHHILMDNLGQATAPETAYQAVVQDTPGSAFITLLDDRIIEYSEGRSGGSDAWKVLE